MLCYFLKQETLLGLPPFTQVYKWVATKEV